MPILYPSIMKEFHLNYTQIGLLASSYLITLSFLQLFAGMLSARFLRKVLIGVGMIWMGLSAFASGLAHSFQALILTRSMAGTGGSVYHPLSGSFLAERFSESARGRMMGLHLAAGNVGSTIAPTVAGLTVLILGWRHTLCVFAVPGVIVGLAFWLLVGEKSQRGYPKAGSARASLLTVLRRREILLLILVQTLMSFRSSGIATFLPGYLSSSRGLELATAAILFSAMYASSIPGPIAIGCLSDQIGRKAVVFSAGVLAALVIWIVAISESPMIFLIDLLVLGIVAHSIPAVMQAFLGDIAEQGQRDAAFSAFFAISMTFGYSLAPALLGIILDRVGFQYVFALLTAISLVAALLILPVKKLCR